MSRRTYSAGRLTLLSMCADWARSAVAAYVALSSYVRTHGVRVCIPCVAATAGQVCKAHYYEIG